MSAQPGWYDAGVPGQERWWDGAQWTAHARAVARAAAPMGWFPVPGTADVRWWDGGRWTPYRFRDGKPRPDAFAVEPDNFGVVFGVVFIALGITQGSTYNLSGQPFFAVAPLLFILSGIVWLVGGIRSSQLKKLPAPLAAPMFDPSIRPLPGEVEGPGAGWIPVAGQVTRWWTGSQWSSYIGQKFGVRPTHAGDRSYRAVMAVGWVLGALSVLGVIAGVIVFSALERWTAAAIILPAVILLIVAVLVLVLTHVRRYMMVLPPTPPVVPALH